MEFKGEAFAKEVTELVDATLVSVEKRESDEKLTQRKAGANNNVNVTQTNTTYRQHTPPWHRASLGACINP